MPSEYNLGIIKLNANLNFSLANIVFYPPPIRPPNSIRASIELQL